MLSVYERIVELCDNKGIKPGKMCNDLKMSRSTMSEMKAGRSTTLKLEKAVKIADYFGVSSDYLLTGEQKTPPAEAEGIKAEVLATLANLPEENQAEALKYIQYLLDKYEGESK